MGVLSAIYDGSPILAQNLMVTAKGWANHRVRYGDEYYRYRQFLSAYDSWGLEQRLEHQAAELRDFLRYSFERSPFYRRVFDSVDLSRVYSPSDLCNLPVLEKETLRANISDIVTVSRRGAVEGHTGGTTGKSLVVLFTLQDNMRRMAMLDHFKSRLGFEHMKMRRATFNGKHIVPPGQTRPVFWRYNAPCKQMIFSSFHVTEPLMGHYVQALNDFKPHAIDGFFSSICDVASYIERHGLNLTFRPIAIFPTSETLTSAGRQLLERVFGCKVYDQYASSEGAPFVAECSYQNLHVELASGVIEPMDGSDEILVTSFTTHGTPLVRYRIGDRMTFRDDGVCPCGNPSPLVGTIEGRRLDFLYTASGAKINAGNVANLFKNMPNALVRAQLLQERVDEVTALLEVDAQLYRTEYDLQLQQEFRHKFGSETRLTIRHVKEIPRESSGKFRMILNNVKGADERGRE